MSFYGEIYLLYFVLLPLGAALFIALTALVERRQRRKDRERIAAILAAPRRERGRGWALRAS